MQGLTPGEAAIAALATARVTGGPKAAIRAEERSELRVRAGPRSETVVVGRGTVRA